MVDGDKGGSAGDEAGDGSAGAAGDGSASDAGSGCAVEQPPTTASTSTAQPISQRHRPAPNL
ncbi:MAG: hypothetical protein H0V92_00070 [Pseudonocardiales bacterium]|nr:hypothetical protein [Pseudonocardiales bacterium]